MMVIKVMALIITVVSKRTTIAAATATAVTTATTAATTYRQTKQEDRTMSALGASERTLPLSTCC